MYYNFKMATDIKSAVVAEVREVKSIYNHLAKNYKVVGATAERGWDAHEWERDRIALLIHRDGSIEVEEAAYVGSLINIDIERSLLPC